MSASRRGRARLPGRWFALQRSVTAHARAAWPNECCGLLARDARGRTFAVRSRNISDCQRFSYTLDPASFFQAACRGLEPSGVYHSHVEADARPSRLDRAPWSGARALIVPCPGRVSRARSRAPDPPP